jgi:hypothetical protein
MRQKLALPGAETLLVEVERMVANSPERHGALHDTLCNWIRYKRGHSPSGWETIQGLQLRETEMLDELAHGKCTEESLKWICDLIRISQETKP